MICNKCGFKNDENLEYCGNCGNKLGTLHLPQDFLDELSKSEIESKKKIELENKKRIKANIIVYNVLFYSVLSCVFITIFLSFFRGNAYFIGAILDILLNIWIWLFIIFIRRLKKNHTSANLGMSITFGLFTIFTSIYLLINPIMSNVLK